MLIKIIISSLCAYLLGSVSSSIIISKLLKLPDPRTSGSNNPGTTNVLRISGKIPAVATLFFDVSKGAVAIALAKYIGLSSMGLSIVMLSVFLGHLYPVFFDFKGGKGVATSLGIFLVFSWPFGLLLLFSWLITFVISRISSLSAIIASIVALVASWGLFEPVYNYAISCIVVLLLIRHKKNIERLFAKVEKQL